MKLTSEKLMKSFTSALNKPSLLVIAAALVITFYAGVTVGKSIGELVYNLTH
ncbi:hypothetical protein [Pontibacter litorisediminis]|uniref:hypothetical protein n=1 Tax=Pontibacter litorisediminis TaxID=1846260 RepID=UPI0023ED50C1|nr:hypothetical protein [Pontibacter litorisediminis]